MGQKAVKNTWHSLNVLDVIK